MLAKCDDPSVRANVFRTRCLVQDKACSLIIDGGVYKSYASTTMIEKLRLPTTKHSCPYKLQCLNVNGEIKVDEQVLISFSIGKYKDEVLCDVVPMQAGHMLLGRQWQFNRQVTYNGVSNKYSFKMNESVVPLPPNQAHEDQQWLQRASEQRRGSKQKKKRVVRKIIRVKKKRKRVMREKEWRVRAQESLMRRRRKKRMKKRTRVREK